MKKDSKKIKQKLSTKPINIVIPISGSGTSFINAGYTFPKPLIDINGNAHNLYTYLNQGKTVFLDFFACHCSSCWAYHNQHELENLNTAHGPNGSQSQDVVVIAIEYDANNGNNEFYGISGNTQGNWIAGTTYAFCNPESTLRSQIINDYSVLYYPLVYGVCSDKTSYNVGTQSASQFYTFASNCSASGVNSMDPPKEVQVNISGNTLFIKSKNYGLTFSLYDISGKQVIQECIENTTENISVADLARGIYYYRAEVSGNTYCGKVFK